MGQIIVKGLVSNRFEVGTGPFNLVSLDRNAPRPVMEPLVLWVLLGCPVKQHGKSGGIGGDKAVEITLDPRIEFILFQGHGVVEAEKSALWAIQALFPVGERKGVETMEIGIVQHRSANVSDKVLNLNPPGISRPSQERSVIQSIRLIATRGVFW
jgi:hypothetical protein